MPRNTRWVLCIDWETDSPEHETCNPVQLAAVPIHPETLEIRKDQAFDVIIRPPGIDKPEYLEDKVRAKTIQWHADNYGVTPEEIIEKWKGGVAQKIAWKNFCSYCAKYEVDKKPGQWYPQPIPAGYNITDFDIPIARRMAAKHKTKLPFSEVAKLDAEDMMFWWFESLDEPYDMKMDTWREFLGMNTKGVAHDALVDVFEEAAMVVRFMKYHRRQTSVDKFKGSFIGVEI